MLPIARRPFSKYFRYDRVLFVVAGMPYIVWSSLQKCRVSSEFCIVQVITYAHCFSSKILQIVHKVLMMILDNFTEIYLNIS